MELHMDQKASPRDRAADLLGRMTLREKTGQLTQRLYGFACYERRGEEIVLSEEFGKVRVETDINTLTAFTPEIGEVFKKNRTMRCCNSLANDIYREFSRNYLGKVNNNDEGRALFQAAILSYLLAMYSKGARRQRPVGEDVEVLQGDAIDSIAVNLALYLADAVEKIYMTVTVS